ncbi:MAG TPA: hypothetical protein VMU19_14275 [Bryobacteraceae bacterium]|nr:hypothetical protein [Bryobacteraceae bacterium]
MSRRVWPACAALFLAGLGTRVLLLILMRWRPYIEWAEMERLARSLAETGTLANPFYLPTGPSAHHAPLYPLLLALIFRAFGYGRSAAETMIAMNLTFAAAQFALLPALARKLRLPVTAGVLAGALGAIPVRILKELRWETTLNGLLLMACSFLAAHWLERARRGAYWRPLATGLLLGAAMIALPMYLTVLLPFLALASARAWRRRETWLGLQAATVLAGAALGVSPWIARNYAQLGGFAFVRDNYPLELRISNHDGVYLLSAGNYGDPSGYMRSHEPLTSPGQALLVRQMGELGYNRLQLREALAWCGAHKTEFLRLTAERTLLFWFTFGDSQFFKSLGMALLSAAALWGAVLLWRRRAGIWEPLLAIVIGFPLPYYFVEIDTRYAYPMAWCLFLLAAWAVWETWGAPPRGLSRPDSGS